MPSRIIREGILTSERVNSLSPNAELFYRRLMSVVDDYGRFSANLTLLRASCYPLKLDSVKEDSIKKHLAECVGAGLIVLFTVADKTFLELQDFRQQVRAKESKYPSPDGGVLITCKADAKQVISDVHLDVVEDVVDKNNTSAHADMPDRFPEFWAMWPSTDRKAGKAECAKRWKARKLDAVADQILGHVAALKHTKKWQEGFEPAPLTYINQKRWEDGLPEDHAQTCSPWENAL